MNERTEEDLRDYEWLLSEEFEGSRVLLVEDDLVNQEIALELLEDTGLKVDLSDNGKNAVQSVLDRRYDLILMDMILPGIDGLETTKRIRGLVNGAAVPIVAVTANAFKEDRQRCIEAGMNDFLSKPFNPDTLYKLVYRWLSKGTP